MGQQIDSFASLAGRDSEVILVQDFYTQHWEGATSWSHPVVWPGAHRPFYRLPIRQSCDGSELDAHQPDFARHIARLHYERFSSPLG